MKRNSFIIFGLLLGLALALAAPQRASALTNACTHISNTATVSFEVGGVAQTNKTSTAEFWVGNKVNVDVNGQDTGSGGIIPVIPLQTNRVMTFRITNSGNAAQTYGLSISSAMSSTFSGHVDSFDAASGVLNPAATTAIVLPGDHVDVTYTAVMPDVGTAVDDAYAVYQLTAVTKDVDGITTIVEGHNISIGAQNSIPACSGDVVFGDAATTFSSAHDGQAADREAFHVATAALTVTKVSAPVFDPVNCTLTYDNAAYDCGTNTPKAIPEAMIEYTITIANSGGAAATNVNLSDSQTAGSSVTYRGYKKGLLTGHNCSATEVLLDGTTCTSTGVTITPGPTQSVTVTGLTVNASSSRTIKYQVTIN